MVKPVIFRLYHSPSSITLTDFVNPINKEVREMNTFRRFSGTYVVYVFFSRLYCFL